MRPARVQAAVVAFLLAGGCSKAPPPITDPSWTPLFVPAAGVVVDVGAPLSHAIIVSRELGIPCVISATGATRRIPNGARVRVDGSTGVVTVLELP